MAVKLLAAGAALSMLGFALPASASVLYATNFAGPTFTNGALAGQGGWGAFTNGSGVPTVQNTVTDGGEPTVDLGLKAAAYYLYGPVTPTGPITVSMDIYDANATDLTGMTFAVISSSGAFNSGTYANDVTAGVRLIGNSFAPIPDTASSLTPFSLDQWYNVAMTLDYASQTYSIAVDGSVVGSDIPFCGYAPSSHSCTGAQSSQFEGIELYNAIIKSGGIYFGNVSISAVPEPASWTMMLAGFALAGLTLRSRRSALAA